MFLMRIHAAIVLLLLLSFNLVVDSVVDLQAITLYGSVDRSSQDAIRKLALAYKLIDNRVTIKLTEATTPDTVNGLVSGKLDFGIGIQGWDDAIAAGAPNLKMLPLLITGYVPVYRLDQLGDNAPPLVFTRQAIVGIFTGGITNWQHHELATANPLLKMPDQNITVVLDGTVGARHAIVKQALSQFNVTEFTQSGMQIDIKVDYPVHKYAQHLFVPAGLTSMVTAVTANDGAFALSYHSVAESLGTKIGAMVNKAGAVVTLNHDSLSFAALEHAQTPAATPTTAHVLTDPSGKNGWPLALVVYVMIDTQYSSHSCRVRESVVNFFSYVYENSIAQNILTRHSIVPVPELVRVQSNVLDVFTNQVMCRGATAMVKKVVTQMPFGVSHEFYQIAQLLASVYDDSVERIAQSTENDLMIAQLATSEIDLVLVQPDYVTPELWETVVSSDDYLILPLMGAAAAIFFNPSLTETIEVDPSDHEFAIDIETQIGIMTNCVRTFNDPRMLATNPWLEALLGNTTVPIVKALGCVSASSTNYFSFFNKAMAEYLGDVSQELLTCFAGLQHTNFYSALTSCTDDPNEHVLFTDAQSAAPLLAMGNYGAMSFQLLDEEAVTASKVYPKLWVKRNGVKSLTTPDRHGVQACASDTFNPETISFDFSKSKNPECWPTSQTLVAVVRKQYWSTSTNSSSCTRGYDTLNFLQWFFNADAISTLTDAFNVAQLSQIPGVKHRALEALSAVRCDDDTLLVKMPTIWELSSALFGFGMAAAIIGMVYTLGLAVGVLVYHRDPIIRASSPLFILISLFGVLMMIGGVIALVSPVTNASCNALAWLIVMGSSLTFAPIFAKIYRVYRIFQGRRLSVVKISNHKLMILVSVVLFIELAFMCAWQAVSPLRPYLAIEVSASSSREYHYTQCTTNGPGDAFLATAGGLAGLLMVCGSIMAFSIRGVANAFNESKAIGISIYNTLFTVGVIAAIVIVIEAQGEILVALIMMATLWVSIVTASVLVCPKLSQIYHRKSGDTTATISSDGSSGFSFLSMDVLDSLPMIGSYILALRRHLQQVEARQTSLKRAKGGFSEPVNTMMSSPTAATRISVNSVAPAQLVIRSPHSTTTTNTPDDQTPRDLSPHTIGSRHRIIGMSSRTHS